MPFRDANVRSCGVTTGSEDWALDEAQGTPAQNDRRAAESLPPAPAPGERPRRRVTCSTKRLRCAKTRQNLLDVVPDGKASLSLQSQPGRHRRPELQCH